LWIAWEGKGHDSTILSFKVLTSCLFLLSALILAIGAWFAEPGADGKSGAKPIKKLSV